MEEVVEAYKEILALMGKKDAKHMANLEVYKRRLFDMKGENKTLQDTIERMAIAHEKDMQYMRSELERSEEAKGSLVGVLRHFRLVDERKFLTTAEDTGYSSTQRGDCDDDERHETSADKSGSVVRGLSVARGDESLSTEDANFVMDLGSYDCKVGYSNTAHPRHFYPYMGGGSVNDRVLLNSDSSVVGESMQSLRDLPRRSPMRNGMIDDWDGLESIMDYIYREECLVDPTQHGLSFVEKPWNPKSNRERFVEMAFETLKVPMLQLALEPTLALYASGRVTGVVLEVGDSGCYAQPVYDGVVLSRGLVRGKISGCDLTDYMMSLTKAARNQSQVSALRLPSVGSSVVSMSEQAERQMAYDIKNKYCYVSSDYESELQRKKSMGNNKSEESSSAVMRRRSRGSFDPLYEMPNGLIYPVGKEQFVCSEALFRPSLIFSGGEAKGVQDIVYSSIQACEIDVKRDLYRNIILSGGSTMMPGFDSRLSSEITTRSPPSMVVSVLAMEQRHTLVWQGGCVYANMTSSPWMYFEDYEEYGASFIHRICPNESSR